MTCEQLRDEYGSFALGAIEEPERSELRGHLNDGCPNCVPGVRDASRLVAHLAATVKLVDPPARLRRRLLASVAASSPDTSFRWATVFGSVALLSVLFSVHIAMRHAQVGDEFHSMVDAMALVSDPAARQLVFSANDATPAHGKVFVVPSRGVLLLASNLPPAPTGKTYEMWTIPKSGNPSPAGVFNSTPEGNARHIRPGPVDSTATAAVAVTLEPATGSPQPTTKPFIVAPL